MHHRVIRALSLKLLLIWFRNIPRIVDSLFWPIVDLSVWGFLTMYLLRSSSTLPAPLTFLIGAAILWRILFRSEQVVAISFFEEVWSRNLINVFAAPISFFDHMAATCLLGLIQALLLLVLLGGLSFVFYSFNFLTLGFWLFFLFINLMFMGWALGFLAIGLVLRFGPSAEILGWLLPFIFQPLSAVFYPVRILPAWLRPVALCIPSSHVFEGMRQILTKGYVDASHIWCAVGLNVLYLFLAGLAFQKLLNDARREGVLAKYYQ